ncbi:glycosyltransferase [Aureimonas sp. AU12]|uniref:glycosyltransferase n=1 Tax=Aureimonas sp. AU12 TaxID=1638161 RepID=UPI0007853F68|nr:glycosyltransferase [Aureimonas sp. AU12]
MTPEATGSPFDPRRLGSHPAVAALRTVTGGGDLTAAPAVVAIPARREAGRIEACLAALLAELKPADAVVLAVNGSYDATLERAKACLERAAQPFLILDIDWREGCGSAPLARRFALDTAAGLAPGAALLSLDADTLVQPGWRAAYEAEFARGFALVCGAIGFIPEEAALLPPLPEADERLLRDYRAASREIAACLDPDPHNPWPHHGNIGGANFGLAGGVYAGIGGLPDVPFGEDRALLRRCEGLGLAVRFSEAPLVWTSPRLDGRASGGLSDELARARREADPVVDEALEPAAALDLRHRTRAAFRRAGNRTARAAALAPLRLTAAQEEAVLTEPRAGLAWQRAEEASPALARRRFRHGDLVREWPAMAALLARVRAG